MTKAKAVEILNREYDNYLMIEKTCLDVIIKVDDKQVALRDRLDEIKDTKIALLTAIDTLERSSSVEAVPVKEWISIKDRKPDSETWALVYIKYPSPVFELERGIHKTSSIKKMFYDGKSFYCDFGTITHWMLFPEPPKESDAE